MLLLLINSAVNWHNPRIMNVQVLQEFARKASNQDLVYMIATKQFSDDELVIFETEVHARGLERDLEKAIQEREVTKNSVKASVGHMTKEDLLANVCYNPFKFTEAELTIFRNEVTARGLEEELSKMIKSEEADSVAFKEKVLNSSEDVSQLLQNFNEFIDGKYPDIAKRVQETSAREKKQKLGIQVAVGIIVMAIGVGLSTLAEGTIIFIGAIVTGVAIIVKGIMSYTRA